MYKIKKQLIPGICILLLLFGCKKKAIDINPEYIGNWSALIDINDTSTDLTIDDKGKAHYKKSGPTADEDFTRTARIKDNVLYLGHKKHFKITQEPTAEYDTVCVFNSNGDELCTIYNSTMILDNTLYYRVVGSYTK